MATQIVQEELLQYFEQLNIDEQESFLNLIKTIIKGKENDSILAYNAELEKADAEIEDGEFMLHEDVKKLFQ